MRALNTTFELFDTAHLPAAALNGRMHQGSRLARTWETQRKIQKQWEQSQGVLENKGHRFFRCCMFRAFGARTSPNLTPKGAKDAAFCENEARPRGSPRDAVTVTNSRLVLADKIPRLIAERREGRGFSPATENGSSLGALAPEGTWPQGLKAQVLRLAETAGLKPRPSRVPRYHDDFGH
jgi:hypothetical protein